MIRALEPPGILPPPRTPRLPAGPLAAGLARVLPPLLLAVVALLGIRLIADGDVWWHLKTGEVFFQQRSFPDHDPFVFTAGEDRWIIRAWLTEVVFYLVFRAAGHAGLTLFKTALFTLAVGLLWRLGVALESPGPATAMILLLASLTASPRLAERPETVSFLLLAATLAILLRGAGGRGAYLLVPLQVVWANVHSSFFVGLLLPWPFLVDAAWQRLRGGGRATDGERPLPVLPLLLAALLLWPASALTPPGIRLVLYPLHMARMPSLALIDEVRGLVTILRACPSCLEEGIAFLILALGALAVVGLQARAGRGAGPGTWALLAGAAEIGRASCRERVYVLV